MYTFKVAATNKFGTGPRSLRFEPGQALTSRANRSRPELGHRALNRPGPTVDEQLTMVKDGAALSADVRPRASTRRSPPSRRRSPTPCSWSTPCAQVRWANRAAERLFGIPVDEAIGQNGLDFIHPDDIQLAALALTSVQAKEVGSLLELRVRSSDGWRLVEMIGAPLGDSLVLSVRDLTERRRWEVAGDEVARFRSLMQNAASVTMLLTTDGVVESSSGGLTRILGLDQEWLEHRPLADAVDDRDHAALGAALRDVQLVEPGAAPIPVTIDVRFRHTSGGTVPFALTFTNLLDDPTVVGLVATGHDITDRVAAVARSPRGQLRARRDAGVDRRRDPRGRPRRAHHRAGTAASPRCGGSPPRCSSHATTAARSRPCSSSCATPAAFVAKVQGLYDEPETQQPRPARVQGRARDRARLAPAAHRRRGRRAGRGASATSPSTAGSRTS